VASVHEDNLDDFCGPHDRWTSTHGNDAGRPEGDGNWANDNTFGSLAESTTDDYKNAAFHDMEGVQDMLFVHVKNGVRYDDGWSDYDQNIVVSYFTTDGFLHDYGNLAQFFAQNGLQWGADHDTIKLVAAAKYYVAGRTSAACGKTPWDMVAPNLRSRIPQSTVGEWSGSGPLCEGPCSTHVSFGVSNPESDAFAFCPYVDLANVPDHNFEHSCVGGGGHFTQGGGGKTCNDFPAWNWNTNRHNCDDGDGWSRAGAIADATILMFYR
jgi:intelectin